MVNFVFDLEVVLSHAMSGNGRPKVGERPKDPRRVLRRRSHEYVDVASSSGETMRREGVGSHDQELDIVDDEFPADVDEVLVASIAFSARAALVFQACFCDRK